MGDDFSAATQAVVSHETIRETDFELVGSGTFIDEDDLTEKYKTKPQQLPAMLKNAKKVEDPIRECTLYEEMTYVAKTSNKEKLKESSFRSITKERESKKAKKAKPQSPHPGFWGSRPEAFDGCSNKDDRWLAEDCDYGETENPRPAGRD